MIGPLKCVDRKRVIQFLDCVKDQDHFFTNDDPTANVIHARQAVSPKSLAALNLSADRLVALYRESLVRGQGRLVHRFERRVGRRPALCYQNSATPLSAFVFFHGFDGSPYDFVHTVKHFYDRVGGTVPSVWILPAGLLKSREMSTLQSDQPPWPSPTTPASPSVRLQIYECKEAPDLRPSARPNDNSMHRRVRDLTEGIGCEDIDPSGGYRWWDIAALSLFTGRKKGLKILMQAIRQNLRTPKSFHVVRQEAVTVVEDVCSIWNLDMSHVFVGGFSQGAMLVSDLVVAVPRPLAGAVMLSGAPVGRSEQRSAQRENRRASEMASTYATAISARGGTSDLPSGVDFDARAKVPLFMSHGLRDPIVPFPVGRLLRRHMAALGFADICFESFSGGHDFPIEVGDKLLRWLLDSAGVPERCGGEIQRGNNDGGEPKGRASEEKQHRLGSIWGRVRAKFRRNSVTRAGGGQEWITGDRSGVQSRQIFIGIDGTEETDEGEGLGTSESSPATNRHGDMSTISVVPGREWSTCGAEAVVEIAEVFLAINYLHGLKILPRKMRTAELDEGGCLLTGTASLGRRMSMVPILGAAESEIDWTQLNKDMSAAWRDQSDSDLDDLGSGAISKRKRFNIPLMKRHANDRFNADTPSTLSATPSPRASTQHKFHIHRRKDDLQVPCQSHSLMSFHSDRSRKSMEECSTGRHNKSLSMQSRPSFSRSMIITGHGLDADKSVSETDVHSIHEMIEDDQEQTLAQWCHVEESSSALTETAIRGQDVHASEWIPKNAKKGKLRLGVSSDGGRNVPGD